MTSNVVEGIIFVNTLQTVWIHHPRTLTWHTTIMRRVSLPAAISPSHNFAASPVALRKVSVLGRVAEADRQHGDTAASQHRKLSVVWARTTPGEQRIVPGQSQWSSLMGYSSFIMI